MGFWILISCVFISLVCLFICERGFVVWVQQAFSIERFMFVFEGLFWLFEGALDLTIARTTIPPLSRPV
jgi:hypothetical protein